MAQRLWTADWHLGSSILLDKKVMKDAVRPFKDTNAMQKALLHSISDQCKPGDVVIHVGDFASAGVDRGYEGLKEKPNDIMTNIPVSFVNLRGNHDINNRVFCFGESMSFHLSKRYPFVSASHYPSYDQRALGTFIDGTIHFCGHVHRRWKHCLDTDHSVMNINVGVDVWNYRVVHEHELIAYLDFLFKKHPDELFKVKISQTKKLEFIGQPFF